MPSERRLMRVHTMGQSRWYALSSRRPILGFLLRYGTLWAGTVISTGESKLPLGFQVAVSCVAAQMAGICSGGNVLCLILPAWP